MTQFRTSKVRKIHRLLFFHENDDLGWYNPEVSVKITEQGCKLRSYPILIILSVALRMTVTHHYAMEKVCKINEEEPIQTAPSLVVLYASTITL